MFNLIVSAINFFGFLSTKLLLSKYKFFFRLAIGIAFIASILISGAFFLKMFTDIYSFITKASSDLSQTHSGMIGCIMEKLGISDFLTSFFAITFSALTFWILAIAYLVSYKLTTKLYQTTMKFV